MSERTAESCLTTCAPGRACLKPHHVHKTSTAAMKRCVVAPSTTVVLLVWCWLILERDAGLQELVWQMSCAALRRGDPTSARSV
ncbi:hypothetical protein OBBRIDRAFT_797614 [Obba rivulosa]|uniref:Uncharacterized protein n=1 Tax=Obba rivulosa TaxID=1052685 RepID=A0A8E2AMF3_9APHY|nr:hypothetical protein OBBRIDRAFT_797614 [Obba rivulosa]